jgi:hypothetical protein
VASQASCCYTLLHNLTVGDNVLVRVTAHNPADFGPATLSASYHISGISLLTPIHSSFAGYSTSYLAKKRKKKGGGGREEK